MIAHLTGILSKKTPEYSVIDVNGVGYRVFITLNTFYELPEAGEKITLLIYTYVREDALKLFGFLSYKERLLFEQLIAINKVGPKLARNILSKLSVDELESAILKADAGLIHSIPGIGEKTAQRLVIELKDKVSRIDALEEKRDVTQRINAKDSLSQDTISALINLGYSKRDAQRAVRACFSSHSTEDLKFKDLIKLCLDMLTN